MKTATYLNDLNRKCLKYTFLCMWGNSGLVRYCPTPRNINIIDDKNKEMTGNM
jgi:hypothetical protein